MEIKRIMAIVLSALLALSACSMAAAEAGKRVIVVDGGGDQNNFNSTRSMEKSDANPYPYNELELLIKEYNAAHPDVEVQLLPESKTDDREALIAMMTAGEAPDIVFQNMGVTKNADIGSGWFVALNDYFQLPNPYEEGNEHWSDVFNPMWLKVTGSSDGNFYYCPIDAIPVGMLYNMDLLRQAGIESMPETYVEFMEAQEALNEIGVVPYLPINDWYNIVLQGQLLAAKVEELDVLTVDGVLDSEEIARGFKQGTLSIGYEGFQELLRIIVEKSSYYPENWQGADVMTMFLNGEVAMIEGVGAHMRMVRDDKVHTFEVGTGAFPLVTEETSPYASKAVIRGSAGYSTTWQINAKSIEKGTIDDCVDFLMFLTAADNNARMVNTFSSTTPANMSAKCVDLFQGMMDLANEDIASGFLDWHACSINDAFDAELNDIYKNDLLIGLVKGELSIEAFTVEYQTAVEEAIARMEKSIGWDESRW